MFSRRALALACVAVLTSVGTVSCAGGGTIDNDSCPGDVDNAYYPEVNTNGDPVGTLIPQMPHTHVAPPARVTYEHNPPTSGCHYSLGAPNPAPILPGAYTQQIDPEYWVHNLEHGYMVVLYNCPQGCDSDFQALREWLSKQQPDPEVVRAFKDPRVQQARPGQSPYAKVVILPWTFDHKFAAVAWDYYDPFDKVDTGELDRFYQNHLDQEPESGAI